MVNASRMSLLLSQTLKSFSSLTFQLTSSASSGVYFPSSIALVRRAVSFSLSGQWRFSSTKKASTSFAFLTARSHSSHVMLLVHRSFRPG